MPNSFSPVINKESTILILGTLPGAQALQKNQYYANPKNQFWDIVYSVFSVPIHKSYEDRCAFLRHRDASVVFFDHFIYYCFSHS